MTSSGTCVSPQGCLRTTRAVAKTVPHSQTTPAHQGRVLREEGHPGGTTGCPLSSPGHWEEVLLQKVKEERSPQGGIHSPACPCATNSGMKGLGGLGGYQEARADWLATACSAIKETERTVVSTRRLGGLLRGGWRYRG